MSIDFSKIWRRFWRKPTQVGHVSPPSANLQRASPESRVGPRAAAWVAGRWEKAQYLAPAAQGYPALVLNYGLYLPPGASAAASRPLVVMLHGCTQTSEAFARGTRMNVLADRHGFAVLYPEQPSQRHAQTCWHWYDPTPAAGGVEAHAIVALVEQLVEQQGFDAGRIYLAGLSAGAGLATRLAFQYPQWFAAVALHSGMVYGAARSVTSALDVMRRGSGADPLALARAALPTAGHPGMPALLLHGARDEVVHPHNLEQLETQFLALNGLLDASGALTGATLETAQRPGYTERIYRRADCREVQACVVDELGHAWSGGDDTVPFHAGIGPDASQQIWDFFDGRQRLPVPASASPSPIGTA